MFYRRHLPHWQKPEAALFLTWRLFGSLPRCKYQPLRELDAGKEAGKAFLLFDRELDKALHGPTWLKEPILAKLVVDSLWYGQDTLHRYRLTRYVVMSNHVPHANLAKRLVAEDN